VPPVEVSTRSFAEEGRRVYWLETAPRLPAEDVTDLLEIAFPLQLPFRLERVGPGLVLGGEEFGVTWKTIDSGLVVIRLRPRHHRNADGALQKIEGVSPE
jgi:hypothetical protein